MYLGNGDCAPEQIRVQLARARQGSRQGNRLLREPVIANSCCTLTVATDDDGILLVLWRRLGRYPAFSLRLLGFRN